MENVMQMLTVTIRRIHMNVNVTKDTQETEHIVKMRTNAKVWTIVIQLQHVLTQLVRTIALVEKKMENTTKEMEPIAKKLVLLLNAMLAKSATIIMDNRTVDANLATKRWARHAKISMNVWTIAITTATRTPRATTHLVRTSVTVPMGLQETELIVKMSMNVPTTRRTTVTRMPTAPTHSVCSNVTVSMGIQETEPIAKMWTNVRLVRTTVIRMQPVVIPMEGSNAPA
jgi:hypothetical protein